jgi:hypothetical protein
VESVGAGLVDGRREGDTGGAEGDAGGRTRRRAHDEALAVVLDLSLGQRIKISDDFGPGVCAIERRDAVLQRLLEHERKEAAENVTADGLVELVEDRPCCEQVLGGSESLLHGLQLLVAERL